MTLKEELDKAKADLSTAETEREGFKTKHEAEVKAHGETKTKLSTAETDRDTHKANHEAEVKAHGETKGKLSTAETDRDALKAKDTTAGGKAAEQLAANGIPPAAKDTPASLAETAKDGAGLYAQYEALMNAGQGREASNFWAANEKALLTYANSPGAKAAN